MLLLAAATAAPAAEKAGLEDLRARAQRLGDNVSGLERQLAALTSERDHLEAEIAESSAEIGVLETGVQDVEEAYDAALARYVDRAIEAYKSGPGQNLAMLLAARTFDDFYMVAEAHRRTAREDRLALAELVETKRAAERVQDEIDARKQNLLRRSAIANELSAQIEARLTERRTILGDLSREVRRLEREARLVAAEAAQPSTALVDLLQPSGPAPGIPDGFAGTGVTFSGIASWYGPGFEGNTTANGDVFDSSLFTAASRDLPFGTWLYVTHAGRGVVVLINDRGPYIDDRVLDLSHAAAQAIGISGLGWIEAEILIKTD